MSLQTLKEGHLSKRGKVNTEYRIRLFVLNRKQLSYFKGGKHTPSGTIELRDVRQVSDLKPDGSFTIETPSRIYEIKGESREDGASWVEEIRKAKAKLK